MKSIKTVSFWVDNHLKQLPFSKDALQQYLNSEPIGANVLTANGELYATTDTPGYCDGEITISRNELLRML